jgi:predicted DNA-binding protein
VKVKTPTNKLYTQVVACAISKEHLDRLHEMSDEESMTMSTYLRRLITQDIKNYAMRKLSSKTKQSQ